MKMIYDKDSHKILGGQIMSKENVIESINTISVAISANFRRFGRTRLSSNRTYDRPWNYLNVLAQQALGETYGSDKMLF